MKFIRGIKSLPNNKHSCVATIGNFDGLHLGHQKILVQLKQKALELQLPLTVISFEPLPAEYFTAEPPMRIYPLRDKVRILDSLGVDNFLCLKFDATLANMLPAEFINNVLINNLGVRHLAVGDDFRFGKKRQGDFSLLKELGQQNKMQVVQTATVVQQDERVSSTRIRKALQDGNIATANKLLGHAYQLSGRVRAGDKRGRTIGFPTLNLKLPEHIAPHRGVYAVHVHGLTESPLDGVANLGSRPTVNGTENRLETNVFDFEGDVYGEYIFVELIDFIRAEQRFENFEMLKQQINRDVVSAKKIIS